MYEIGLTTKRQELSIFYMKIPSNTGIGKQGERIAVEFLSNIPYKILKKNFYSNYGEIDIIALDSETLVFVEVKTRIKNAETALESMTYTKSKRIMKTAEYFLFKNPQYEDHFTRFDLIIIVLKNDVPKIFHIKEAISF